MTRRYAHPRMAAGSRRREIVDWQRNPSKRTVYQHPQFKEGRTLVPRRPGLQHHLDADVHMVERGLCRKNAAHVKSRAWRGAAKRNQRNGAAGNSNSRPIAPELFSRPDLADKTPVR